PSVYWLPSMVASIPGKELAARSELMSPGPLVERHFRADSKRSPKRACIARSVKAEGRAPFGATIQVFIKLNSHDRLPLQAMPDNLCRFFALHHDFQDTPR